MWPVWTHRDQTLCKYWILMLLFWGADLGQAEAGGFTNSGDFVIQTNCALDGCRTAQSNTEEHETGRDKQKQAKGRRARGKKRSHATLGIQT